MIDGLPVADMDAQIGPAATAGIADLQLAHPGTQTEATHSYMLGELGRNRQGYLTLIRNYLDSHNGDLTPPYDFPGYRQKASHRHPYYMVTMPPTTAYARFRDWLAVAGTHEPLAAADEMLKMVQLLEVPDLFESEQHKTLVTALSTADADRRMAFGRRLVHDIAHDVAAYAHEPEVMERCAEAPLMQEYASPAATVVLAAGIARLRTREAPDYKAEFYGSLADTLSSALTAEPNPDGIDDSILEAIGDLAEHLPERVTDLVAQQPKLTGRLWEAVGKRLITLGEQRTEEQELLLTQAYGELIGRRPTRFFNLLHLELQEHGALWDGQRAGQAREALAWANDRVPSKESKRLAVARVALEPVGRIRDLLHERPGFTLDQPVVELAVRRLARGALVYDAYGLVEWERQLGGGGLYMEVRAAHYLVALYDELGAEGCFSGAEAILARVDSTRWPFAGTPRVDILANMLVAAAARGDAARADDAAVQLDAISDSSQWKERADLDVTVMSQCARRGLDQQAIEYATRYLTDEDIYQELTNDSSLATAPLECAEQCAATGRVEAATEIIKIYIAEDWPFNERLVKAMGAVAAAEPSQGAVDPIVVLLQQELQATGV